MYSVTQSFIEWLAAMGHDAAARPDRALEPPFVTVERTGGYVADLVDHAMLAIQAWAPTEASAEALAIGIRNAALLGERPRGVAHIAINAGPYPYYDEDTRCPRYQLVVDATCQLIERT